MKPCTICSFFTIAAALFLLTIASCTNAETEKKETESEKSMDTSGKIILTSKYIKGPAGKIFIDDGGQGGIPVLMIHSFGGNTGHWKEQLTHLRPGRRAIALDLRGHGQSDAPPGNDYHVQSLSNDIAAVADSLDLD